jgi:hypothetical protein
VHSKVTSQVLRIACRQATRSLYQTEQDKLPSTSQPRSSTPRWCESCCVPGRWSMHKTRGATHPVAFESRGRGDTIQALLAAGANPDLPNQSGVTPGQLAERIATSTSPSSCGRPQSADVRIWLLCVKEVLVPRLGQDAPVLAGVKQSALDAGCGSALPSGRGDEGEERAVCVGVWSSVAGPGSDLSEEPAWGCEPVTLESVDVPRCPPGPVPVCPSASLSIWW